MSDSLIPPRFLFRFAAPLRYRKPLWKEHGPRMESEHALAGLAELDGVGSPADVRGAWSEEGLLFSVVVAGKRQPPWCRETRLEESDGLQLWIDTRDTHNIHRATRYCHRFVFLPAGGGPQFDRPVADQLVIPRAKENAPPIRPRDLKIRASIRPDGYWLEGLIPAAAMAGFDPAEHPKLGFTYAVFDRELGASTFSIGEGFPYDEDPSVWATLELARNA